MKLFIALLCVGCIAFAFATETEQFYGQLDPEINPQDLVPEHTVLLDELVESTIRNYFNQYLHRDPRDDEVDGWASNVKLGNYNLEDVEGMIKKLEDACRKDEDCAHGYCLNYKCICDPGYSGLKCDSLTCPNECSGKGSCMNGQCLCMEGYTGLDCSEEAQCPRECSKRGDCVKGRCVCQAGFTGADCGNVEIVEIGEVGFVFDVTDTPKVVTLRRTYTNPVVLAMPASDRGVNNSNAIVRILSVTSTSFQLQLQLEGSSEPLPMNSVGEAVGYVAFEAGEWVLPDKKSPLIVGTIDTTATIGVNLTTTERWDQVAFGSKSPYAPVVLAQTQTIRNERFAHARIKDISSETFQVALEGASREKGPFSSAETVGYVALEPRRDKWSNVDYEAGQTLRSVGDLPFNLQFKGCFDARPVFVGQTSSRFGRSNAHLRYGLEDSNECRAVVKIEDTYIKRHNAEMLNYFAFGSQGVLSGYPADLVRIMMTKIQW